METNGPFPINQDKFSSIEAIKFGWQTFKTHKKYFLYPLLGLILLTIFSSLLSTLFEKNLPFIADLMDSATGLISSFVQLSLTKIALIIVSGRSPTKSDFFTSKHILTVLIVLISGVLYSLVTLFGFLLLIVPGIIFTVRYSYYSFVIFDKNSGPVASLKESFRITKGYFWKLSGFFALTFLLILLGVLALGIGFLVTYPVSLLASAYVYKKLTENKITTP